MSTKLKLWAILTAVSLLAAAILKYQLFEVATIFPMQQDVYSIHVNDAAFENGQLIELSTSSRTVTDNVDCILFVLLSAAVFMALLTVRSAALKLLASYRGKLS